MTTLPKKAPINKTERQQLNRDADNIKAAANRKQVTLDKYEEIAESRAAKNHFELGCWLYRFTKLRGLPAEQYLQERVNILLRLFLAGIFSPAYDFFTVFDFGERQFDTIFEEGDSDAVVAALRRHLPLDQTGKLKKAFEYNGWSTSAPQPEQRELALVAS